MDNWGVWGWCRVLDWSFGRVKVACIGTDRRRLAEVQRLAGRIPIASVHAIHTDKLGTS